LHHELKIHAEKQGRAGKRRRPNGGDSMNEVYTNEQEQLDAELTTAALAGAGERTGLKKDLELQSLTTELQPKAAPAPTDSSVSVARGAPATVSDEQATPLFSPDEAKDFRARWDTIQAGFVDEPRRVVEQADSLVAGTMKRLAEVFADERARLEGQWDRGDSVSTEDLRLALRRYRSFFGRLLSV
jgi:hypothetical protein